MTELSPVFDQARLFLQERIPENVLGQALPLAIGCLVVGVVLSVLGAKLARFGLTGAFVVAGGAAGVAFGKAYGFPQPVCALVGAAIGGTVGFLTFRLWVGVTAALVLSSLAMGTFGYQRVLPHVPAFQEYSKAQGEVQGETMTTWNPVDGTRAFSLPTAEEQLAYQGRSARDWASGLWSFVTSRDLDADRHDKALGLVALITGLCLGVVAVRWMLILATSLVGTVLVATGTATLVGRASEASYETFAAYPGAVGIGLGGFLATSLIVQALVTRKAPAPKAGKAVKS